MKPGKQAQHTSTAASQAALGVKGGPTQSSRASSEAVQRPGTAPVEESDLSRTLELWWDRTLAFFVRHRATSVLVVWLSVSLIDTIDLHMPAEWLVFTLFSFSVFVQAFSMSVLLFAALTIAMTVLNVAIYYLLPFSATALFSTIVVCMLLVRGVHGLNARGWMVTAVLSLSRLHTPWCGILPDYLQAPIAAYCTSFGMLWLLYHNSRRLERLIDPLCILLGIIPPLPPRVGVVEIHDTSVVISWADSLTSGFLDIQSADTAPDVVPGSGALSSSHSITSTNPAHEGHINDIVGAGTGTAAVPGANACIGGFGGPSSTLSVGRLLTIDRKTLPEARVSRYDIEVNSHVVGSCKAADSYTKIQGLRPATMYQLRVWAVSQSRGRSPSLPVFVSTLTSAYAQARENDAIGGLQPTGKDGMPVDVDSLRSQIEKSKNSLLELETTIAQLKDHSEKERTKLQTKISELRARRKLEESLNSQQKDKISEMEIQKRNLDREKAKLTKEIADAQAQKQRAIDKLRDQEKQVRSYIRNAKTLEATMERERKDHDQQQAELNSTIDRLKSEVDRAKSKLQSLSERKSTLTNELKSRRAELTAQEKRNAELNKQINTASLKNKKMEYARAENATAAAKLHSEIKALSFKLESTTRHRQKLEKSAKDFYPPKGSSLLVRQTRTMSQSQSQSQSPSIPAQSPALGGSTDQTSPKDIDLLEVLSAKDNVPASAPENAAPVSTPPSFPGYRKEGAYGKHGRSSSFASSSNPAHVSTIKGSEFKKPTSYNSGFFPYASQNQTSPALTHASVPVPAPTTLGSSVDPFATGYANTVSRRSADLGDIFGLWDRRSNSLASSMTQSSGLMQPIAQVGYRDVESSSAAIDSISLRNAAGAAVSNAGIASIDAAFQHRLSPAPGGLDTIGHLGNLPIWGNPDSLQSSSLSTTTAEASALSILKDTDLAYPTPTKATHEDVGSYAGSLNRSHHEYKSPQPPPPVYSMFGSGPSRFHQQTLSGVLNGPFDTLDQLSKYQHHQQQQQQRSSLSGSSDGSHFRFNSLDLRSAAGWGDRDFRESGRSSIVSDRRASPCVDVAGGESRNSFTFRNGTPVEQPALFLSNDLLGNHHALSNAGVSAGDGRPHVDPIGAPTRRRNGGSPSLTTPDGVHSPPFQMPRMSKHPIEREISHPSSFGDSLYHKRSLWDLETSKPKEPSSAANNDKK
ncbi:hypothetical protein IWW45_006022 [Coemansia sp. RSA 485]|nr:hypothetical protein IWW45_006022 [Coemansia sp. RSA 485]